MSGVLLLQLLHVLTVGFFGGGLLAMMMAQSYLQRSLEDTERRNLAELVSRIVRLLVVPMMTLGFVLGLVLMVWMYGGLGMGKLMACTPVYVHIMMGFGILALGFSQVWKARARKFAAALTAKQPLAEARVHLTRGWIFAWLALAATLVAFAVAVLKVPNPPRSRCVAPTAAIEAPVLATLR